MSSVSSRGASYLATAQLAVVSLGAQTPFLTWLCVGRSACSLQFETGLKAVMEKYVGDGTLQFSRSQIRVVGLDITLANRAAIENELASRGAVLAKQQGGPLISSATFDQVVGVPGLKTLELAYLADRVVTVRYPITGEADYAGFAKSLDERYGVATPSTAKGCTTREWDNGGVAIVGDFCAATPLKTGFTFINTGAARVLRGLDKVAGTPSAVPTALQPKPRTDMY